MVGERVLTKQISPIHIKAEMHDALKEYRKVAQLHYMRTVSMGEVVRTALDLLEQIPFDELQSVDDSNFDKMLTSVWVTDEQFELVFRMSVELDVNKSVIVRRALATLLHRNEGGDDLS